MASLREQVRALTAEIQQRPAESGAHQEEIPEADRRRVELDWLSSHAEEIAAQYRGQGIAIAGQRVVASGPDLETVVRRATDAGYPDALFTGIPTDEPKHWI